jgi:hypothetical protein
MNYLPTPFYTLLKFYKEYPKGITKRYSAKQTLLKAGLLRYKGQGEYEITEKGLKYLKNEETANQATNRG